MTQPTAAFVGIHHSVIELLTEATAIVFVAGAQRTNQEDTQLALHGAGRLIEQARAMVQGVIDSAIDATMEGQP